LEVVFLSFRHDLEYGHMFHNKPYESVQSYTINVGFCSPCNIFSRLYNVVDRRGEVDYDEEILFWGGQMGGPSSYDSRQLDFEDQQKL
jgi:hypothetical protein